ncbi:TPA: zinc transporter, partial [Escherichia coli]|nr:zinc transporter [Escherichia coli]
INNNTKTELAKKTYMNMTERAKKRQKCTEQKDLRKSTNIIEKKTDEDNKQRGGVKGFFSTISENKNEIDHDPSATNEKFINKYL